jgi:hypothetical protein
LTVDESLVVPVIVFGAEPLLVGWLEGLDPASIIDD